MENLNESLRAERDSLIFSISSIEGSHSKSMLDCKKDLVGQQEKLEKQFKKELVMMDAKYRQIAFDKLTDKKKKALLENAKLKDEIVLQKIGLANLSDRILAEKSQLEDVTHSKKSLGEQTSVTSSRIAALRRSSFSHDARIADIEVTLAR